VALSILSDFEISLPKKPGVALWQGMTCIASNEVSCSDDMRTVRLTIDGLAYVLMSGLVVGCGANSSFDTTDASVDGEDSGGCLPGPDGGTTADSQPDSGGKDSAKDAVIDVDPDREWLDCPSDMVAVGPVCVDRYEASRSDATAMDQGVAVGPAHSVPGVIPWHVDLMTSEALAEFEAACVAANKRICRPEDWRAACEGATGSTYVYGNVFDARTCNCVDTYCADWCLEHGVEPENCDTGANCGYVHDSFHLMPTGSFPMCTNELRTFDMTGNVWEVVPSKVDVRGFEVRGGAFNCAGAIDRLTCTFNATWAQLFAGFRCCLDRI